MDSAYNFREEFAQGPVRQFESGNMRNFIYLIVDSVEKKAALVDCQHDLSRVETFLRENSLELQSILITHSHHDHIAGLQAALTKFPHVKVLIHKEESKRLKDIESSRVQFIQEGELLKVGDIWISVLHTPGHSKGECCYLFQQEEQNYLFTGDTLFVRDCGRTDLEGGNDTEMFASLQRIKKLSPSTLIFPGHHYVMECFSTLEKEILESGPLKCDTLAELTALA